MLVISAGHTTDSCHFRWAIKKSALDLLNCFRLCHISVNDQSPVIMFVSDTGSSQTVSDNHNLAVGIQDLIISYMVRILLSIGQGWNIASGERCLHVV